MRYQASIIAAAMAALLSFGCGAGPGQTGFPDEADEAVLHVVNELQNDNPGVLWEALPQSYRSDISGLVHELAGKLDAEIYNKAFDLVRKLTDILKTKKELILASSSFEMAPADKDAASAGWDSVVGILETVVNSDLSDLEKVKTLDIGAFVADTGNTFMTQASEISKISDEDPFNTELKAKLSQVQVELVSSEAETAVVKITVPDEPVEELTMVRVEDRWVPKEMADEWDEKIAEAKEQLSQLDEEKMAQTKMQAMMMMGMAEAFLDQIAAVNSSEELDQVLQGLLGGFLGGGSSME